MNIVFLDAQEADEEINEKALPIFHDFRHRKSDYTWYRNGSDDEFSEFTFDPAFVLGYHRRKRPQMNGFRDTGLASGQYCYCRERAEPLTPIVGPKNPFIVSYKAPGEDPGWRFGRFCRTLLRLAEHLAGEHNWLPKNASWNVATLDSNPFPIRDIDFVLENPVIMGSWLKENPNDIPNSIICGQEIIKAVVDWAEFRQVHPLNILLSRLGFDGVSWAGEALKYGDCGSWGCLLFPPISFMGEVIGLNLTKSIYMLLPGE